MQATHSRHSSGLRLASVLRTITVMVLFNGLLAVHASGQNYKRSRDKESHIVESGEASEISEKVRAASPGVLVALNVQVGDTVTKGQILGHTELDTTRYQLDLAQHAYQNNTTLNAMKAQYDASTAIREETEKAVRKRNAEETRLEWASSMERYHKSNFEAQQEQKKLQLINLKHFQKQYENRFFKAPVDGVVSEIRLGTGQSVTHATHVFTITNDEAYMVPVEVSAEVAAEMTTGSDVPVRAMKGKHVAHGTIDTISDSPSSVGKKVIRLLVNRSDFPSEEADQLSGTRFSVLLPQPGKTATFSTRNGDSGASA